MANPNQIISSQLAILQQVLQEYVVSINGTVGVASNVQDLWYQSSQSSQKPIIYICYAGETAWSNSNLSALTHRVSRNWIVRVKQGRGVTARRGDTVLEFVTIVEEVRDVLRTMQGISQDFGIDYEGTKYVRLGDSVMDAYDIAFSTKNDLPQILQIPDDSNLN